jgi:hypothetical protein
MTLYINLIKKKKGRREKNCLRPGDVRRRFFSSVETQAVDRHEVSYQKQLKRKRKKKHFIRRRGAAWHVSFVSHCARNMIYLKQLKILDFSNCQVAKRPVCIFLQND